MKRALIGFAMIVLFAAAGCVTAPLENINNSPITTGSGKSMTLAEIEKAIERAADSTVWRIQPVGPGQVIATKKWYVHMAAVDIKFTTDSYSITYKTSNKSVRYDGSQIHPKYNIHVKALDTAIKGELGLL